MNRKERRAKGIKNHEPILHVKASDIERMRENDTREAVELAFALLLAIPVQIIHDKFGQLMKKEGREQRFAEMILELYDLYNQGYVTLEDLAQCLEEETGMKLKEMSAFR